MAREYRGGYYKMDHESFGQMMVSEQLRPALRTVSKLIAGVAGARARADGSSDDGGKKGGPHLADSYEPDRGPIMVIFDQGMPGPRITDRVVNRLRHAAANEFGLGGWQRGRGSRNLRRAGEQFGNLAGESG